MKYYLDEIKIRYLAVCYFVQQNFTDWKGAKEHAEWIVRTGWHV